MLTLEVLRVLLVNHVCQVTPIIKYHVQRLSISKAGYGLLYAPLIFLLALTFPREDRDSSRSNAT